MDFEFLPYLLLLISILLAWRSDSRLAIAVLGAASAAGLYFERLEWVALPLIAILGLSLWLPSKRQGLSAILSYAVFTILAVAFLIHLAPGFNNLAVFERIRFSEDSVPFSMYLNFDKVLVGLFLYLYFVKPRPMPPFTRESWLVVGKTLSVLVIVLVPLALISGYVRPDPKWPALGWVWMLNNLFFVCLAEEGFFRGFIQKGLSTKFPVAVSIGVAAVLFGLAHYKGEVFYVAFATLAGLFYGYAYHRTGRLESSLLVHFGLNLIHFLLFSYPALV